MKPKRVLTYVSWLLAVLLLGACSSIDPKPAIDHDVASLSSQSYTITNLGDLGGGYSYANAINDNGVVVGRSNNAAGQRRAFIWTSAEGMQDLGDLGGSKYSQNTYATAINNNGVVVGQSINAAEQTRGFIWTAAEGMQDLGTLGGRYSYAHAINNNGVVLGGSGNIIARERAFIWTAAGGMQDLGDLGGGSSNPGAINNNGVVVGGSINADNQYRAFIWTAAEGMQDLGDLGGGYPTATAINDNGVVVGGSGNAAGQRHAFIWTAARGMQDLGTLDGGNSSATAINNNGVVVGHSINADNQSRAFIWTAARGMQDLGDLGGGFSRADAINKNGVVIGESRNAAGQTRAFIWTAAGGMQDLGDLHGGYPTATAINDNGVVLGRSNATGRLAGQTRAFIWTPQTSSPTDDGDGIASSIDGSFAGGSFVDESGTFSNSFTDQHLSGTSFGEIIDRGGLQLSLVDSASADEGVVISAQGGSGTAKVKPCGVAFTLSLTDGDKVIATCGSLTAKVVSGEVDITLSNGAVVTVSQPGATAHISEQADGNFLVKNLTSSGSVVIKIGELTKAVEPGKTAEAAPYDFSGFFQPVDNLPTDNRAKAGSAIPVRFSLDGNQGLGIIASGYPKAQTYTCITGALTDAIEQTVTAGSSSLSYDATSGRYTYVWKTDKSWTGCRQLIFKFKDGQEQRANFQFTK